MQKRLVFLLGFVPQGISRIVCLAFVVMQFDGVLNKAKEQRNARSESREHGNDE